VAIAGLGPDLARTDPYGPWTPAMEALMLADPAARRRRD
jgi:hypothetical protein